MLSLTDRIIPSLGLARSGPGRPPGVTDAELACLTVAQVLLRYDDERHWLRAAASRIGHLFPRLLGQTIFDRLRSLTSHISRSTIQKRMQADPQSGRPKSLGRVGRFSYHRSVLIAMITTCALVFACVSSGAGHGVA
jgi:hypothetical protein